MKSKTIGSMERATEAPGRFAGGVRSRRAGLFVSLLLLLGGGHLGGPGKPFDPFDRGVEAKGRSMDNEGPGRIFVCLEGPNDGEPINSRIFLRCSTNASEGGYFQVSANGIFLYSQPFSYGLRYEERTGLYVTAIDVDLELLHRLFPARFHDPDAAPFTITVSLYSTDGSSLITHDDWVGYIGKPWIDVTKLDANRAGNGEGATLDGEAALGTLRVVIHPLAKDTYYFLLASPDRDLLTLSPEDPPLLRHARKLGAGSCGDGVEQIEEVLHLDRVSDLPWDPSYVVLWTFDFYGGWKRSAIFTLR